jgi:hypothetical protein
LIWHKRITEDAMNRERVRCDCGCETSRVEAMVDGAGNIKAVVLVCTECRAERTVQSEPAPAYVPIVWAPVVWDWGRRR